MASSVATKLVDLPCHSTADTTQPQAPNLPQHLVSSDYKKYLNVLRTTAKLLSQFY